MKVEIDIRSMITDEFTESQFNELLENYWNEGLLVTRVVATKAQKRTISSFAPPTPLKRTLLDKLLFRTRYSDNTLKAYPEKIRTVLVYNSDVGTHEIVSDDEN